MILLRLLWLFLPAAVANMTAGVFRSVNLLNYPIDGGLKFRGKPLLGSHKTVRGFLFGILVAILIVIVQIMFQAQTQSIAMIDYSSVNPVWLGFLLGFGALCGDSLKSFFKRQVNIQPGESWIPFDQIDWIIGAIIFISLYQPLSWLEIIVALLFFGLLHPIFNLLGYTLRLQKNKL